MDSSANRSHCLVVAILGIFLLLTAITTPIWAESQDSDTEDQSAAANSATAAEVSLVKVDPKYVCMPNNRVFKKEQLSTEIEGKTYYGCCKMCINALNSDPQQRFAVDPVSGKEIDKAEAIIGAAPDNSIYYFETEENLESFKIAASDKE